MKLPGNMQAMMKQAEQMQRKMQDEIALIRVEASAGGGMVSTDWRCWPDAGRCSPPPADQREAPPAISRPISGGLSALQAT